MCFSSLCLFSFLLFFFSLFNAIYWERSTFFLLLASSFIFYFNFKISWFFVGVFHILSILTLDSPLRLCLGEWQRLFELVKLSSVFLLHSGLVWLLSAVLYFCGPYQICLQLDNLGELGGCLIQGLVFRSCSVENLRGNLQAWISVALLHSEKKVERWTHLSHETHHCWNEEVEFGFLRDRSLEIEVLICSLPRWRKPLKYGDTVFLTVKCCFYEYLKPKCQSLHCKSPYKNTSEYVYLYVCIGSWS